MKIDNEYTNLGTGAVIRVVDVAGPHEVTVITLVNSNGEETSQQRKRKMNPVNLYDTVVKDNGEPRTSGWVLISDDPEPTKRAVPAAKTKEHVVTANISPGAQSWDEVDFDKMPIEILIQTAHRLDLKAKEAVSAFELAKEALKKKIKGRGVSIAGESAISVSHTMAFSPELAKKNMTPAQIETFTTKTLDAKAIKAYFGEKSADYRKFLVPAATVIRLRPVTDQDLQAQQKGQLRDPFTK